MASNPRLAKALRNKGVTQQFWADNYVIYALSKAKPSAAYITTVTDAIIVSIVNEGNLLEGRKCEDFINKIRIPGGDIACIPDLPDGLSDTLSLNPLFANLGRWRR